LVSQLMQRIELMMKMETEAGRSLGLCIFAPPELIRRRRAKGTADSPDGCSMRSKAYPSEGAEDILSATHLQPHLDLGRGSREKLLNVLSEIRTSRISYSMVPTYPEISVYFIVVIVLRRELPSTWQGYDWKLPMELRHFQPCNFGLRYHISSHTTLYKSK